MEKVFLHCKIIKLLRKLIKKGVVYGVLWTVFVLYVTVMCNKLTLSLDMKSHCFSEDHDYYDLDDMLKWIA